MAQRVPTFAVGDGRTPEAVSDHGRNVCDGALRAERHLDLSTAWAGERPGGYAGSSGLRPGAHDFLRRLRPPPSGDRPGRRRGGRRRGRRAGAGTGAGAGDPQRWSQPGRALRRRRRDRVGLLGDARARGRRGGGHRVGRARPDRRGVHHRRGGARPRYRVRRHRLRGIGGITLAGGVGYLVRKYGMTIDNLMAAEVVTADGELLRANAQDHPDLFWALRGGGGNFGVATRFQFRLHPLGQVVGGMLLLPASADVLAEFIALAEAAPEELSTIANVMPAPPLPFIPAEQHGQLIILGLMVYAGDVEDGQRAVAPFRSLATPLADLVRPMAYPEIYPPEDPNYHPAAVGHTMLLDNVDHNTANTILEHLQASDATLRVAQLRVLGGAMARVPVEATAFAHRRSAIMANVASFYDGPADKPVRQAWVDQFAAALHQR